MSAALEVILYSILYTRHAFHNTLLTFHCRSPTFPPCLLLSNPSHFARNAFARVGLNLQHQTESARSPLVH